MTNNTGFLLLIVGIGIGLAVYPQIFSSSAVYAKDSNEVFQTITLSNTCQDTCNCHTITELDLNFKTCEKRLDRCNSSLSLVDKTALSSCRNDLSTCSLKRDACMDLKQFDDYFKSFLAKPNGTEGLISLRGETGAIYLMTTHQSGYDICSTFMHELGHYYDYRVDNFIVDENTGQEIADDFRNKNLWRCWGLN